MGHKHQAISFEDFGYPAHGEAQDQRAAGGIVRVETCGCGATREIAINGRFREETKPWHAAGSPAETVDTQQS